MLRTVRLFAIPASLMLVGTAVAGPWDQYKPPAAPPATNMQYPVRVAQNDVAEAAEEATEEVAETAETATEETGVDVSQTMPVQTTAPAISDGGLQPQPVMQESYVPPAPQQTVIVDSSAETTVMDPYAQPTYSQPTYSQPTYSQPQYRGNDQQTRPFQRLMELERRKNAWLRRTFLNR